MKKLLPFFLWMVSLIMFTSLITSYVIGCKSRSGHPPTEVVMENTALNPEAEALRVVYRNTTLHPHICIVATNFVPGRVVDTVTVLINEYPYKMDFIDLVLFLAEDLATYAVYQDKVYWFDDYDQFTLFLAQLFYQ